MLTRTPPPGGDPREGQGQEQGEQGPGGEAMPGNQGQFEGSDIVDNNTRVLSENLVEILSNPEAQQWDDGWAFLDDGYKFRLWSRVNPEPMERENEQEEEFVVRQHAARRDRIRLLANRAERTRAAQQAYEQSLPPPPVPPPAVLPPPRLPANESTDSINMEFTQKQTLLNQLANRAAEDITDPLDKAMFDYLDRVQAEAARAAFQKVLDNGQEGLNACTEEERQIMVDWKNKSESRTQKRAEQAARQLGVYSNLMHKEPQRPADPLPRVTPIRVTCPKYNPASDPIGSMTTWLAGVQNFHSLQRITDLEDKKRVLFSSIDINAQFRLGDRLLPTSPFVQGLSYDQYVEQIRLIFSPPEESQLWKSDYKNCRQSRSTNIVDYLQKKAQLFQLGYRDSLDSQHFIEEAILHVFHTKVRTEIYRANPTTFADLVTVSQRAVGLIRLTEAPTTPQAIGLASVTHPAASAAASTSSRASNLVGEMMDEVRDFEEEDEEDFVEPLTIAQMDFCMFNESETESTFWNNQPDGSEASDPEGEIVGEMVGTPQNSPASPEGPCWFCSARGHVKKFCPARLKAVHAKVGSSSRPPRGGRGGRSRFEEVRRGSSRRGRSTRGRPSASTSGRSAVGDSRRGIFPVRDRRVGEISDAGQPGEEHEVSQEVGGLYNDQDYHYDQPDF